MAAGVLCFGLPTRSAAQGWTPPDPSTDPWNTAKLKIGPIFVAPSFTLRDVGIDNNVFRDPANPKKDLTGTIAVSTIFGVHVKAFSFMVTQDNRYIWFRRYASERSIDGGLKGVAELRLQNLRPWVTVSKTKTHERAGYEVDARAGREVPIVEYGADVNFGLRTGMTASFSSQETKYDEDASFDGVTLRETLDRRTSFAHFNGRWQYSEFSDLVAGYEWTRNTFTFDPIRDADATYYYGGFQSRGDAPITGRFQIGYKTQKHKDPAVPDFKGVVVSGNITTIALDRLKLDLTADRDLAYSYDDAFPYYVQQGGGLTVTGRVSTRLDLIASAKGEWLNYSETYLSAGRPLTTRTDLATVYGVGFMFTAAGVTGSHFGLTFERAERRSPLEGKSYRNDRVLTDVKFSF